VRSDQPSVTERLVLVSDLHLGGGAEAARWGSGFADPFDEDAAFVQFLAHLHARDAGPCRLVMLGDTVDFLRVPVIGPRAGLYARNDAEASGQLDRIHAAHGTVFGALAGTLASGVPVDFVVGNHDVELARPAVQDRLRDLLADHGCPPSALRQLRFHPWGYHLRGVLYAEHGNHYHDINTFERPLHPFRNDVAERPPAARLGGVRRVAAGGPARSWRRDVVADLLPRGRLGPVARAEYRASLLAYAEEVGLAAEVVGWLHDLGHTSFVRIARRLLKSRLLGGPSFSEQLPHVAALVHEVLSSRGQAASFYIFGHAHVAMHVRLAGPHAHYLNTGTWSTDRREPTSASGPDPAHRTWVEIEPGGGGPPVAKLMSWAGGPVELPDPGDTATVELEETEHGAIGQANSSG